MAADRINAIGAKPTVDIGKIEESHSVAEASTPAARETIWTPEAQSDFDSISKALSADLGASPAKKPSQAADRFGSFFVPFTEKHGLEVGANLLPTMRGFGFADITLGTATGVPVPYNALSDTFVHTHPYTSEVGFSGRLDYNGKRLIEHRGDIPYIYGRQQSGYAYRSGPAGGVWFFDYPGFMKSYREAQTSGASFTSDDFVRRIR